MLYLYWILFFLKKIIDYEKIDVTIQTLKSSKAKRSPIPKMNVAVTFSVSKSIYGWPLNRTLVAEIYIYIYIYIYIFILYNVS